MYNWRILLGGAASAAILTAGLAAPALAQSVSRAGTPASLSGMAQDLGGSTAAGILCDLPGIPMAGPEASAAAGVAGAPCDSAAATQDSVPLAGTSGPASDVSRTSSSLPGLNSRSGSVPDLSSATGVLSGTANLTGSLPQANSVAGATQGATAGHVGSGSSLLPGGSLLPGSISGSISGRTGTSSGTTGLGSVTGTVNNITGHLPGGNSITGDLGGQGSQGS